MMSLFGKSLGMLRLNDNNEDQSIDNDEDDTGHEQYTEKEIKEMFKGRIIPENIFKTYKTLSGFKFNDIEVDKDDDETSGGNKIIEKINYIKDRIEMVDAGDKTSGLSKKNNKTLYEIADFVIESPSYSYVDDKDNDKLILQDIRNKSPTI